MRHITQPAFSRRIEWLEAWAGIDLVDRSSYPTPLTPAGVTFRAQAQEVLGSLQATCNMVRGHKVAGNDMIEFAVPQSVRLMVEKGVARRLRRRRLSHDSTSAKPSNCGQFRADG